MKNRKQENIADFHVNLLLELMDMQQFPFTELVIKHALSKEEYDDLFKLLEELNEKYQTQKEEGFLNFTALLIHFAGMLNGKLDPNLTIAALKKEGYYPSLMEVFIKILQKHDSFFAKGGI